MKNLIIILAITLSVINVSAQSKSERKQAKLEKAQKGYIEIKELIDSKAYTFTAKTLTTTKGGIRHLTSDYNLTIAKDSAMAFLPYIGVAQSAGFGMSSGIEFDNEIKLYEVTYNDKKRRVVIEMEIETKDENLNIYLTVTSGNNSTLRVNSTRRNSISYNGMISVIND